VIITRAYIPFFPFLEASIMVNAERVKRKLPSLLGAGSTNRKKAWRAFMRYRYRYEQFKKSNSDRCNNLTNKIIADLSELEEAIKPCKVMNGMPELKLYPNFKY
jgi:hypothetical protein